MVGRLGPNLAGQAPLQARDCYEATQLQQARRMVSLRSAEPTRLIRRLLRDPEAELRPAQRRFIGEVMTPNNRLLVVMPTSAGKSMLYVLPLLATQTGVTILIVPTVALLDEVVDTLRARNLAACGWDPVRACSARLVVLTPEAAVTSKFAIWLTDQLKLHRIDRVVFDECHAILDATETGFRDAPLSVLPLFSEVPSMLFLSATVPPSLVSRFEELVGRHHGPLATLRASTRRPNIAYKVVRIRDSDSTEDGANRVECAARALRRELAVLRERIDPQAPVMVFCRASMRYVTALADLAGLPFYRSPNEKGMPAEDRAQLVEVKRRWDKGEIPALVCTPALGEGTNRPSVAATVVVPAPSSMMQLAQVSGRAARQRGSVGYCTVIDDGSGSRDPVVQGFMETSRCRRLILDSFMDGPATTDCAEVLTCLESRARCSTEPVEMCDRCQGSPAHQPPPADRRDEAASGPQRIQPSDVLEDPRACAPLRRVPQLPPERNGCPILEAVSASKACSTAGPLDGNVGHSQVSAGAAPPAQPSPGGAFYRVIPDTGRQGGRASRVRADGRAEDSPCSRIAETPTPTPAAVRRAPRIPGDEEPLGATGAFALSSSFAPLGSQQPASAAAMSRTSLSPYSSSRASPLSISSDLGSGSTTASDTVAGSRKRSRSPEVSASWSSVPPPLSPTDPAIRCFLAQKRARTDVAETPRTDAEFLREWFRLLADGENCPICQVYHALVDGSPKPSSCRCAKSEWNRLHEIPGTDSDGCSCWQGLDDRVRRTIQRAFGKLQAIDMPMRGRSGPSVVAQRALDLSRPGTAQQVQWCFVCHFPSMACMGIKDCLSGKQSRILKGTGHCRIPSLPVLLSVFVATMPQQWEDVSRALPFVDQCTSDPFYTRPASVPFVEELSMKAFRSWYVGLTPLERSGEKLALVGNNAMVLLDFIRRHDLAPRLLGRS